MTGKARVSLMFTLKRDHYVIMAWEVFPHYWPFVRGIHRPQVNDFVITFSYRSEQSVDVILTHWGRDKNGRHLPDDIFKCIFVNKNVWISLKISLKFVPKGLTNNTPALVQIMAWRRPGDKPLSEPMMVNLPTHICVIRPQWVNGRRRIHP